MSAEHSDPKKIRDPYLDTGQQDRDYIGIRCPQCDWFFVDDDSVKSRPDECHECGCRLQIRYVTAATLGFGGVDW